MLPKSRPNLGSEQTVDTLRSRPGFFRDKLLKLGLIGALIVPGCTGSEFDLDRDAGADVGAAGDGGLGSGGEEDIGNKYINRSILFPALSYSNVKFERSSNPSLLVISIKATPSSIKE